jgi:hypothetical protein
MVMMALLVGHLLSVRIALQLAGLEAKVILLPAHQGVLLQLLEAQVAEEILISKVVMPITLLGQGLQMVLIMPKELPVVVEVIGDMEV